MELKINNKLKFKIMTKQKELTQRQIKSTCKQIALLTGQPLEQTTNELLIGLEFKEVKDAIYKVYDALNTNKQLTAKIKRFETLTA